MNSGSHGFTIDVAFKIQIFVRFFLWFLFIIFIFLLFLGCIFDISYVYFFVPRYITTYICMPGGCKFFYLMCRCWYRKTKNILENKEEVNSYDSKKIRFEGIPNNMWAQKQIQMKSMKQVYKQNQITAMQSSLMTTRYIIAW